MTKLFKLAQALRFEDSNIGDLCTAILQDEKFPRNENEENQIVYLMHIGSIAPEHVEQTIIQFLEILKNYDGI